MGNYFSLFIEGILSFLSPCILPLLPVYLGYLSGGKDRKNTFKMSVGFVLGICLLFFLMAFLSTSLMPFFNKYKTTFQIVSGFLLIFMALNTFGIIKINSTFLTNKLSNKINDTVSQGTTFIKSFILGLLLTLSWTPCIGPMLATVFVQASNSSNQLSSFLSILSFSIGFSLCFILLGLFADKVLDFFKKNKSIVKYTHIISGLLVLCVGIYFLFLGFKSIQSKPDVINNSENNTLECCGVIDPSALAKANEEQRNATMDDVNFILKDSNGNLKRFSDYKGKTAILSFSATWCGYCNLEWPEFNEVYNSGKANVVVVTTPQLGNELTEEGIKNYMEEKGYNFDVLYDNDASVNSFFYVYGLPTTYFFDAEGNLVTYVPGYVDATTLSDILTFCETKDQEIWDKYNN